MRLGLAAGALLVGVAAGCDGPTQPPPSTLNAKAHLNGHPLVSPTEGAEILDFETELLALVNAHRVSLGLDALVDSGELRDEARAHSEHMIVHRFFDHISPEGLFPATRLDAAGIEWAEVGENIAAGYATPEAVFQGWLSSPGHRTAIEDPDWTHTGVGYAVDGEPTEEHPHVHYWTQSFVRR